MSENLTSYAQTFVRHWLLAARESMKFEKSARGAMNQPDEAERQRMCDASSLAQMLIMGGAVELSRLLQWRFDQAQKYRLAAVQEYLNVVLEVLQEEDEFRAIGHFDWDALRLRDGYAEPYLTIFVDALAMAAKNNDLELAAFCSFADSGCLDEVYWDAEIRLYEGDEFVALPFFRLSGEFAPGTTSQGEYIGEMYGLDVRYDADIEEMLAERDRAEALEADSLDITDVEKLEALLADLTWLDFVEDREPGETNEEALLAFVEDRAERIMNHYATEPEEAVSVDGAGEVLAAADAWQSYEPYQKQRLIDVYRETHPE